MNTEHPDRNARPVGWLFYDSECRIRCESARRVETILTRRRIQLRTLQSPDAPRQLGLSGRALFRDMRLLLSDGRTLGGADAVVEIARRMWWARPLRLFSRVPGVRSLMHVVYRVIAANRHCIGGACKIPRRHDWRDWLPLLLLPATTLAVRDLFPAWVFMGSLASAIFLGCKWLTLRRARTPSSRAARFAYLLVWPGMDAEAFLSGRAVDPPKLDRWLIAGVQTVAGAVLLCFAARPSPGLSPLLIGWLGMVGLVMMLHFGVFHLLSLGWRAAGRNAKQLMQAPLLTTSLADFWGSRWNTAFNVLANDLVFRQLARPLGVSWATLAAFLVSGVVHDLVISLPARGGYGLPTGYFVLQAAGVLFERSRAGRALGLGNGWRGRMFALITVATPAFWLFHPPFVRNVILPMLHVPGATGATP